MKEENYQSHTHGETYKFSSSLNQPLINTNLGQNHTNTYVFNQQQSQGRVHDHLGQNNQQSVNFTTSQNIGQTTALNSFSQSQQQFSVQPPPRLNFNNRRQSNVSLINQAYPPSIQTYTLDQSPAYQPSSHITTTKTVTSSQLHRPLFQQGRFSSQGGLDKITRTSHFQSSNNRDYTLNANPLPQNTYTGSNNINTTSLTSNSQNQGITFSHNIPATTTTMKRQNHDNKDMHYTFSSNLNNINNSNNLHSNGLQNNHSTVIRQTRPINIIRQDFQNNNQNRANYVTSNSNYQTIGTAGYGQNSILGGGYVVNNTEYIHGNRVLGLESGTAYHQNNIYSTANHNQGPKVYLQGNNSFIQNQLYDLDHNQQIRDITNENVVVVIHENDQTLNQYSRTNQVHARVGGGYANAEQAYHERRQAAYRQEKALGAGYAQERGGAGGYREERVRAGGSGGDDSGCGCCPCCCLPFWWLLGLGIATGLLLGGLLYLMGNSEQKNISRDQTIIVRPTPIVVPPSNSTKNNTKDNTIVIPPSNNTNTTNNTIVIPPSNNTNSTNNTYINVLPTPIPVDPVSPTNNTYVNNTSNVVVPVAVPGVITKQTYTVYKDKDCEKQCDKDKEKEKQIVKDNTNANTTAVSNLTTPAPSPMALNITNIYSMNVQNPTTTKITNPVTTNVTNPTIMTNPTAQNITKSTKLASPPSLIIIPTSVPSQNPPVPQPAPTPIIPQENNTITVVPQENKTVSVVIPPPAPIPVVTPPPAPVVVENITITRPVLPPGTVQPVATPSIPVFVPDRPVIVPQEPISTPSNTVYNDSAAVPSKPRGKGNATTIITNIINSTIAPPAPTFPTVLVNVSQPSQLSLPLPTQTVEPARPVQIQQTLQPAIATPILPSINSSTKITKIKNSTVISPPTVISPAATNITNNMNSTPVTPVQPSTNITQPTIVTPILQPQPKPEVVPVQKTLKTSIQIGPIPIAGIGIIPSTESIPALISQADTVHYNLVDLKVVDRYNCPTYKVTQDTSASSVL